MSLVENVQVIVPGHRHLSYDAALVSFYTDFMSFNRPSEISDYRHSQVNSVGAHIFLRFPCIVLFFFSTLGDQVEQSFMGDSVGELTQRSGSHAVDEGKGRWRVREFSVKSCLTNDIFWLNILGKAAADAMSRSTESFEIRMEVSVRELAEVLTPHLRGPLERRLAEK